jgi:hypothetical protein
LKFQALESSIDINGAFCLIEKKKEERGGEGKASREAELGAQ